MPSCHNFMKNCHFFTFSCFLFFSFYCRVHALHYFFYLIPPLPARSSYSKGQCHGTFCFWFFLWINVPPAPEYPIRIVSNFLRKFAEIFASQGSPPVSTTPAANCHRYQRHRWQTMGTIIKRLTTENELEEKKLYTYMFTHWKKPEVENLTTLSL